MQKYKGLTSLSSDLNRLLYSSANNYDVNIQVGEGSNSENFKAHSIILQIRSTYFNSALSSNWAKKEGNIFIFKKPNVKPDVFRFILKFIYTGIVDFDDVKEHLGELLIAADEINLNELFDYIQKYIEEFVLELSNKNIILIYNALNIVSNNQMMCNIIKNIISKNALNFFNDYDDSNLFLELSNESLISLIQNDNFKMKEIEIWNNLIKWAIAKNPTISSHTSTWKSKEFGIIRNAIQQFIPHIRFFQMSSDDYYDKVEPLSALLPEKLEKDINFKFQEYQNQEFL
ncbi:hypothetical protein RclHR1_02950004 [Rhizophagus clarus]|nr:hypothetical protein RclHR1_02950004 [Rhizophagus clarus]